MNITAIREGLASSLQAIGDVQVSPYLLSNPTPPYIVIHAAETEYDLDYDDGARLWFGVRAVVPYNGDIGAQRALDEYRAGARSIRQALEADPGLGGACDSVHVVSAGPDVFYNEGEIGCEFRVEVIT